MHPLIVEPPILLTWKAGGSLKRLNQVVPLAFSRCCCCFIYAPRLPNSTMEAGVRGGAQCGHSRHHHALSRRLRHASRGEGTQGRSSTQRTRTNDVDSSPLPIPHATCACFIKTCSPCLVLVPTPGNSFIWSQKQCAANCSLQSIICVISHVPHPSDTCPCFCLHFGRS